MLFKSCFLKVSGLRWSCSFSVRAFTSLLHSSLNDLKLEYSQLDNLSVDSNNPPKNSRHVPNAHFARAVLDPINNPKLIHISKHVLQNILQIDYNKLVSNSNNLNNFINILSANDKINNSQIYSHCYCGYQFGTFAGQLGDGRAMSLGEYVNTDNNIRYEIQLKGSGQTPFSRFADGRAVLRSSIREYLISEHLNALNIPTTRSLCIISSDDTLAIRDILYNGNPSAEKCSIVTRISPSFIRLGSFEISHLGDNYSGHIGPSTNNPKLVKELVDYTILYHFSDIDINSNNKYELFFSKVLNLSAYLVSLWQCYGFIHGVLNTDNMSILGLTMDYGPFGFLEYYNPNYTPNTSDKNGRYKYSNQVNIMKWNLSKFSQILDESNILELDISQKYLNNFDNIFLDYYKNKLYNKFGIENINSNELSLDLIVSWFNMLENTCCDFTNAFYSLNELDILNNENILLDKLLLCCPNLDKYKNIKLPKQMSKNYLLQLEKFLESNPNIKQINNLTIDNIKSQLESQNNYYNKIININENEYKNNNIKYILQFIKLYKNTLINYNINNDKSKQLMNNNNPKYILRNYILQNIINDCENNNFSSLDKLYNVIINPFSISEYGELMKYNMSNSDDDSEFCLSCSS